jgi:hypothetical protein
MATADPIHACQGGVHHRHTKAVVPRRPIAFKRWWEGSPTMAVASCGCGARWGTWWMRLWVREGRVGRGGSYVAPGRADSATWSNPSGKRGGEISGGGFVAHPVRLREKKGGEPLRPGSHGRAGGRPSMQVEDRVNGGEGRSEPEKSRGFN